LGGAWNVQGYNYSNWGLFIVGIWGMADKLNAEAAGVVGILFEHAQHFAFDFNTGLLHTTHHVLYTNQPTP